MSDTGRQSTTDKAAASVKPDSQKSATEQLRDTVRGGTDSAASTLQPEGKKSDTQKASDVVSGNADDNNESLLDKAKDAVGIGGKGPQGRGQ
ncbi:heat shock protein 9/12-domain-containing protein [Melanogaster broomeanus]|nr:heat shock protein 9/12-domain-containing protein [Melanogaster broomeanus]